MAWSQDVSDRVDLGYDARHPSAGPGPAAGGLTGPGGARLFDAGVGYSLDDLALQEQEHGEQRQEAQY
jgi:hypothetical protein